MTKEILKLIIEQFLRETYNLRRVNERGYEIVREATFDDFIEWVTK